jgi:hypothetical protein
MIPMQKAVMVAPGRYQHFKGNLYEVLHTATHTETGEQLVIYRPVGAIAKVWARPIEMWYDEVPDPTTGEMTPRFVPVHDSKIK